jgi:hypothetical protein
MKHDNQTKNFLDCGKMTSNVIAVVFLRRKDNIFMWIEPLVTCL